MVGRPFPKGRSGNPGGRPKDAELADVKAAARQHSAAALQALASIATKGKSESARVAAATAILDRGYGKPTQPVAGDAEHPPVGVEFSGVDYPRRAETQEEWLERRNRETAALVAAAGAAVGGD